MTRMPINLMFAATLLAFGTFAARLAEVRGEEAKAEVASAPQPQFAVFSSLGCSRSFRMDSTHVSITEAIEKAQSLRSNKSLAWVVTGEPGTNPHAWGSYSLIPGRRDTLKVESCSVYEARCRGGWRMKEISPSVEKAESVIAELLKQGGTGEIVYRLAAQ